MNREELEKRMRELQFKRIPESWRAEILSAASAAAPKPEAKPALLDWRKSLQEAFRHGMSSLWPSPPAWASLAAIWLIILALNLAARDTQTTFDKPPGTSSAQLLLALQEQERLRTELIEGQRPSPPRRRPTAPKSHSELPPNTFHA